MRVYYKVHARMSKADAEEITALLDSAFVRVAHDKRMGSDFVHVVANMTAYDAERILKGSHFHREIAFVADP